jgi:hypothetical protein
LSAAALSLTANTFGATIYDNSVNDLLTRFNPGNAQIGDEIQLTGTERYLTRFDFEYWGENTANPFAFAGSVQAQVKFYLNDGALVNGYASPGTVLYDSGLFGGFGTTPRSTLVFTAGSDFPAAGLYLPTSSLTWTVQFSGMGGTDTVGVDIYNPPVVGSSVPNAGVQDYWQDSGGGWQLLTNTVPMNFGARFFASADPVPEPSALPLTAFGSCLAWLVARRARAQK